MKVKASLLFLIVGVLVATMNNIGRAQSIEAMPPVVINTIPESGSTNVAPGIVEIRVTFSKEMADHSWSWATVWQDSTPEIVEKPRYEADHKTCVLKVKLEAGRTYAYWLNSQKFTNFKD